MTTGVWDEKLAEESLGIPMAEGSAWPKELTEAKSVFEATTTRLKNNYGMHVDTDQYPCHQRKHGPVVQRSVQRG